MMLVKIAWKNIWRNKVRSLVVITAIGMGLWAGVFASAFVQGMMRSKVEAVIHNEISHVQVHQPEFRDEFNVKLFIPNSDEVTQVLEEDPNVLATSQRIVVTGMLASAHKNSGLRLMGVDPKAEQRVTTMSQNIVEGTYLDDSKKRPIVISQKTADEFDIRLNSKVVFTVQDIHGDMSAASFKVVGIFETSNAMYDKMVAFAPIDQVRKLCGIDKGAHEIAVWLDNYELSEPKAKAFQEMFPKLEVLPWLDLSLGMRVMIEAMDTYLYIIVGIILVALLFSIVNTMLMAVLERVREIGMLMAVGMSTRKIFSMIMLETVFMSMIGAPVGLLISWLSIGHFGSAGINLSGAAYENQGFASVIYPYLDNSAYLHVTIMVLVMALIAAVYPARKALKLNPVEAIRKV